ncbi:hypothetical protein, partial [Escherichia coli]|uniref:hypothetical protein n=2 Tax=Escherichia coli TaxID=562 RepID=UPI001BC981FA
TADRNRSHWSTSKTPSYTKSVSWQHHPENGDLKENKIFFCVDNSVFTWVLILWYELKKKNTTRG